LIIKKGNNSNVTALFLFIMVLKPIYQYSTFKSKLTSKYYFRNKVRTKIDLFQKIVIMPA